jgi:hypothetical protein
MSSSGTRHHVAVVMTDISDEHIASIIRVDRLSLMMEVIRSSKELVFTGATWCHIPEEGIIHSHHYENLKSYKQISK